MFDISWTEFLLIGIVALVVIGPKELPAVMRTMGQWTRKVRSMAAEFQSQFHEAMREAEMADLKKQVDEMASDIKNYDLLKEVRSHLETTGREIEASLKNPPAQRAITPSDSAPALSAPESTQTEAAAAPARPVERGDLSPAETVEPSAPARESETGHSS